MIRRRKGSVSAQPGGTIEGKQSSSTPTLQPRSEIADLWLRSRETGTYDGEDSAGTAITKQYRKPLTQRPFNKVNLKIALRLARLECRPLWSMLRRTDSKRLKRYLLTQTLVSLAPAAKVQAMASVLNLVQSSLSHPDQPVPYVEIAVHVTFALVTGSLGRVLPLMIADDTANLQQSLDESFQVEYIQRKLSMDIPTAIDPYVAAATYEAGVFSGFALMEMIGPGGTSEGFYYRGVFGFLEQTILSLVKSVFEFASVSGLLGIVCLDIARNPETSILALVAWIPLILVLAFLPIISGIVQALLIPSSTAPLTGQESPREQSAWIRQADLRQTVSEAKDREEIVLFDLANWISSRWRQLCKEMAEFQAKRRTGECDSMIQSSIEESGQVVFYVSHGQRNGGIRILIASVTGSGSSTLFASRYHSGLHQDLPRNRRTTRTDYSTASSEALLELPGHFHHCLLVDLGRNVFCHRSQWPRGRHSNVARFARNPEEGSTTRC